VIYVAPETGSLTLKKVAGRSSKPWDKHSLDFLRSLTAIVTWNKYFIAITKTQGKWSTEIPRRKGNIKKY